jgi:pimeloyl-ACP methyl ester carboxylesterase
MRMALARLVDVRTPKAARAAVVVLHGGASRNGAAEVSPTQLSVLRMIPVARRIALAGRGDLAVFRLLNSARGWSSSATPVQDADWAMDKVRERLGEVPLGLVGHSLGGRAALLAGDHAGVRSVVALNPWVYADDDVDLSGRRVLVVHGDQDRIADPARSARVAHRLARRADVSYEVVPGGKHAMLSHGAVFEKAAARFCAETLL